MMTRDRPPGQGPRLSKNGGSVDPGCSKRECPSIQGSHPEVVMTRPSRLAVALAVLSSPVSAGTPLMDAVRARREPVPAFQAVELPTREYTLTRYPKTDEPCVDAARRVAEAFSAAAGVPVLRSYCVEEAGGTYALKVVYEAESARRPVTTLDRVHPDAGFGAFKERAACEAALPAEGAAFKAATGLEPVAAYCLAGGPSDRRTWSMRIDGFGEPALSPRSRTLAVFTRLEGASEAAFLGGIKAELAAQGVDARFVAWRPTFGYAELSVSYYAKDRLELPFSEPVRVDTAEQCREALGEVRGWTASRSPAPLALYCGRSMTGWEVAWMFKDAPSLKAEPAAKAYRSRAECLKDRAAVVEHQRSALGRSVAGAVCSYDALEYGWKAVVFAD